MENLTDTIVNSIKNAIKEEIDKEYSEYKLKCLEDLDIKLEAKRNDVVRSILNGIDISMCDNQPYSFEPIINIKIEKKIFLKEN